MTDKNGGEHDHSQRAHLVPGDKIAVSQDGCCSAVRRIESLRAALEQQLKLLRLGLLDQVVACAQRTNTLVEQMAAEGIFRTAEFADHRDRFQQLYRNLIAAVECHKQDITVQLQKIRKGRRGICAYRRNLPSRKR